MNKVILAAAAASLGLAAPALAQAATPSLYGNLGYSHLDAEPDGASLNAIHGRIGGRFGSYVGVEAEAAFGVGHDPIPVVVGTTTVTTYTSLDHSIAGYLVGFLPIAPNADLFARIGYGNTHVSTSALGVEVEESRDSINWGAGAQYFFTAKDGLRGEYTRADFRDGPEKANVWSISYVRKF